MSVMLRVLLQLNVPRSTKNIQLWLMLYENIGSHIMGVLAELNPNLTYAEIIQ
jgi:hypothetical protein